MLWSPHVWLLCLFLSLYWTWMGAGIMHLPPKGLILPMCLEEKGLIKAWIYKSDIIGGSFISQ